MIQLAWLLRKKPPTETDPLFELQIKDLLNRCEVEYRPHRSTHAGISFTSTGRGFIRFAENVRKGTKIPCVTVHVMMIDPQTKEKVIVEKVQLQDVVVLDSAVITNKEEKRLGALSIDCQKDSIESKFLTVT